MAGRLASCWWSARNYCSSRAVPLFERPNQARRTTFAVSAADGWTCTVHSRGAGRSTTGRTVAWARAAPDQRFRTPGTTTDDVAAGRVRLLASAETCCLRTVLARAADAAPNRSASDRGAAPVAGRCEPPSPAVGPGGPTAFECAELGRSEYGTRRPLLRGGTSLLAAPFMFPENVTSGTRRTGMVLPAMAAVAAPGRWFSSVGAGPDSSPRRPAGSRPHPAASTVPAPHDTFSPRHEQAPTTAAARHCRPLPATPAALIGCGPAS